MMDNKNNPKEGLFRQTNDFVSFNELTSRHTSIKEMTLKSNEYYFDLIEITKKDKDIIPLFIKDNKPELHILSSYIEEKAEIPKPVSWYISVKLLKKKYN